MEVILLQKVQKLGGLGDKVTVKPGYGRNYLVPQGKAVPATTANVAEFEAKRAEYAVTTRSSRDADRLRPKRWLAELTDGLDGTAGRANSRHKTVDGTAAYTVEDVLWPAAFSVSSPVLYANLSHLDQAGLPTDTLPRTLDELRAASGREGGTLESVFLELVAQR